MPSRLHGPVRRPDSSWVSQNPLGAVHLARITVLAAALVGFSALGPGTHLQAQETLDELRERAELGDPEAQFSLGGMYADGRGVPKDDLVAGRWFRRAAGLGLAEAQYNLGLMYESGRFRRTNLTIADDGRHIRVVQQGEVEAVRWYRLAAEQGLVGAQRRLGFIYRDGQGVPQDYAEAARWFTLAAKQGNVASQGGLAGMYANGWGVPHDYVEAHMWFNLAAAQSSGDTRDRYLRGRDAVARLMTADQIAEAQRRARELSPTPEP